MNGPGVRPPYIAFVFDQGQATWVTPLFIFVIPVIL